MDWSGKFSIEVSLETNMKNVREQGMRIPGRQDFQQKVLRLDPVGSIGGTARRLQWLSWGNEV